MKKVILLLLVVMFPIAVSCSHESKEETLSGKIVKKAKILKSDKEPGIIVIDFPGISFIDFTESEIARYKDEFTYLQPSNISVGAAMDTSKNPNEISEFFISFSSFYSEDMNMLAFANAEDGNGNALEMISGQAVPDRALSFIKISREYVENTDENDIKINLTNKSGKLITVYIPVFYLDGMKKYFKERSIAFRQ